MTFSTRLVYSSVFQKRRIGLGRISVKVVEEIDSGPATGRLIFFENGVGHIPSVYNIVVNRTLRRPGFALNGGHCRAAVLVQRPHYNVLRSISP